MLHFSYYFIEANNKPHCSDAAKLNFVVFFVLKVTAALNTAKISTIFIHTCTCRKPSEENKFNFLFTTSASLK